MSKRGIPRAWRRRGHVPVYAGPEDEAHAAAIAKRAAELAPVLGYCTSCGERVDEAAGKLHSWECPDVPEDRRAPRAKTLP